MYYVHVGKINSCACYIGKELCHPWFASTGSVQSAQTAVEHLILYSFDSTHVGTSRDWQRMESHVPQPPFSETPGSENRTKGKREQGRAALTWAPVIPCSTIHHSALKVEIRTCAPLEDAPRGVKVTVLCKYTIWRGTANCLHHALSIYVRGRPSQQAAVPTGQRPPNRHTSIRHLASLVSTRSKP